MAQVNEKAIDATADAIADSFAEMDGVGEDNGKDLSARIWFLLNNTKGRNPGIWAGAEAPINKTIADFDRIPVAQRSIAVRLAFANLGAAAEEQATIELLARGWLEQAATQWKQSGKKLSKLSRAELTKLAKDGVKKTKHLQAKERRRIRKNGAQVQG